MKVRPKRKPINGPTARASRSRPASPSRPGRKISAGRTRCSRKIGAASRETPSRKETWRLSPIVSSASVSVFTGCWKYSRQEKIQTSFFPTGITVQNYPEIFKEIAEQGHEVGTETWIHDYSYMKKRDKEKKDLQKTVDAVKKVVGKAPVGYLSTGVAPSASTPEIILELGYTYWMDPQHQETPYTLKIKKQELTVLSYFQDLNDYSSYQRAGRTPRDLLQMWKDCFDCLYEEGATDPKFMMWGNHPFVGGRPFRALLLREFIRYAKSHGKVWFAPAGEIAKWYRDNYRDAQVEEWPNFAHAGRQGKITDLAKL